MLHVWTYADYCYIPIEKNASSTHKSFFKGAGWNKQPLDDVKRYNKFFSHIQDPKTRFIKAIAELNWSHKTEIGSNDFHKRIFDWHMLPVCAYTQGLHVDWIIMDHPTKSCNELTNAYFERNNLDLIIGESNIHYKAIPEKKIYQEQARELFETDPIISKYFSYIFRDDIELYKYVYNKE